MVTTGTTGACAGEEPQGSGAGVIEVGAETPHGSLLIGACTGDWPHGSLFTGNAGAALKNGSSLVSGLDGSKTKQKQEPLKTVTRSN